MSPKEAFQASPFARGWNDLVESPQFDAAATAAMLQLHQSFGFASDMATSAAQEWMRQGALKFLTTLKTINQNVPVPKTPVGPQLDHRY